MAKKIEHIPFEDSIDGETRATRREFDKRVCNAIEASIGDAAHDMICSFGESDTEIPYYDDKGYPISLAALLYYYAAPEADDTEIITFDDYLSDPEALAICIIKVLQNIL